jgi:hypothetical protein
MNVVSLFNGMNTGRQALENVGIKVNKYYSSEIKPYAIELTQHHFPDTIQVGDVTKWKEWNIDWKSIDLILSGSPCQDLSAAGKRAEINGSRSSLFFVFVEILEHIKNFKPKRFILTRKCRFSFKVRRWNYEPCFRSLSSSHKFKISNRTTARPILLEQHKNERNYV